jgi:hypothetical protein
MPPVYKVLVTIFVIAAALAAHVFRDAIGLGASGLHLAFLVAVMVGGLWMFPEPKKEKLRKR